MSRRLPEGLAALLPWFGAALMWFAVIGPLRAEKATRLSEQSQVRRAKVKAERTAREAQSLTTRINTAMPGACQASTEPASLRERTIAATTSLNLAPVSLTVTGGADGGASIDAAGSRRASRELLRRLGDPAFGGFLRSVTIRERGDQWSLSAATGLLGRFPAGIGPASAACGEVPFSEPPPLETLTPPSQERWSPEVATPAAISLPSETEPLLAAAEAPPPPFILVAFIESEGKRRVSVRVGGEIRVVSVGDTIDGWSCVSIDRDEGAAFTSLTRGRFVLKGTSGAGR
jgi:hypothetical protein